MGRLLAAAQAVVVTGGLGGVMAAACRGAVDAGGRTLGLLPGSREAANPWLTTSVPTGLGEGRNVLVVRSADAVVAVGGSWGTLSEIALARRLGRPVVTLSGWMLRDATGRRLPDAPVDADGPEAAVRAVLAAVRAPDRDATEG